MKVREKKCKECGDKFTPCFSSFQKVCEKPSCIIAFGKKEQKKQAEKESKEWVKAAKERLKTHSDAENELQPIINRITALIDKGMNCICCDSPITQFNPPNAGHRYAVGGNNSLRFNLNNIHRSGVCCNKHKNGNPDGYDEGLLRIYGQDYFNYVKWEMKKAYPLVKLSKEELEEKKVIAKQIIKELEKLDMTYPPEVRIRLREEYNKRIGIYNPCRKTPIPLG